MGQNAFNAAGINLIPAQIWQFCIQILHKRWAQKNFHPYIAQIQLKFCWNAYKGNKQFC